jgi:osmoprotectant transport system permease protein
MSLSSATLDRRRPRWLALDPLGVLVLLIAGAGMALPFADLKANRIVPGEGLSLLTALPSTWSLLLFAILAVTAGIALLRSPSTIRLVASAVAIFALLALVGVAASHLTPPDNTFARVSPGAGFWLLLFALALMLIDALARLGLGPWQRLGLLGLAILVVGAILWSGAWNDLSILKEYGSRAPAFWKEAQTHLLLAFGSVGIAALLGIPLGVAAYRLPPLREWTLNLLNIVQTIPSIALFGLLIAPLAWVAANVPAADALGISGIGAAPAMVALVAYSLLPIVSNTLGGLTGLPQATVEAARGMGMSWHQRLLRVELPLAFPVILAGIRIVLVQNIGLTTIAALIGGGGFGVFVFQGVGQTAMDLVLLGAVPTVAMAFTAAVVLEALSDLSSRRRTAP